MTPLEGKSIPNRCHYFKDLPAEGSEFSPYYSALDALLKPYYTARGIDSTYGYSSANLYRKYGADYLAVFGISTIGASAAGASIRSRTLPTRKSA